MKIYIFTHALIKNIINFIFLFFHHASIGSIYFEDTRIQPWPQLPPKPNILFCKVNGTGGDRYDNLICSMGQYMFLSEEAFGKLYARLATWIALNNLNGFSVVSSHMFKGIRLVGLHLTWFFVLCSSPTKMTPLISVRTGATWDQVPFSLLHPVGTLPHPWQTEVH